MSNLDHRHTTSTPTRYLRRYMPAIVRIANFDVNLSRLLGEGGFGKVFRAKDLSEDPPLECAAKQMRACDLKAALEKEVELMRKVGDHPSIIGFRHFEQVADHSTPAVSNSAWIFMEMATGGELFDRLIDSGNLTERAVAPYFKGMVEGLLHCHQRRIVHRCRIASPPDIPPSPPHTPHPPHRRDIKLENVMLCAEDPHAIKLVDFGLAVCVPTDETLLHEKVG